MKNDFQILKTQCIRETNDIEAINLGIPEFGKIVYYQNLRKIKYSIYNGK